MDPHEESVLRSALNKGLISENDYASCMRDASPLNYAREKGILSKSQIDGLMVMGILTQSDDTPGGEATPARFWDSVKGKKFGRYELLERLGEGATAIVVKAIDPSLGKTVALKVLKESGTATPALIERFLREAKAMARLRHPNIVSVHEAGAIDGWYFFSMDYLDGSDLLRCLDKRKLSTSSLLEILEKVARACHYAHHAGIVHRDIKPENILLDDRLNPYLTDFGLARLLQPEGPLLTQTGTIMGTPSYMSPEHLAGKSENIDARSDIFSLGIILYEGATGRLPFQGAMFPEVYSAIAAADPVLPRKLDKGISSDLEAVILKALEKAPNRRYQTADEFADDLSNVRQGLAVKARHVSGVSIFFRRLRRHALLLGAIAALVSVTLGIYGLMSRNSDDQEFLAALSDAVLRLSKANEQFDLALVLPPADRTPKNRAIDEGIRNLAALRSDPLAVGRAEIPFEIGRALYRRQDFSGAGAELTKALEIRPDPVFYLERGRATVGQYTDRLWNLPNNLPLKEWQQRVDECAPLLDKAKNDFEKAGSTQSLSRWQMEYAQAFTQALRREYDEAERRLQALAQSIDPGAEPQLYGEVLLALGLLHDVQNRSSKAIQAYEKGLSVQRSSTLLLLHCARCHWRRARLASLASGEAEQELDAAPAHYQDAATIDPNSPQAHNGVGTALRLKLSRRREIDDALYRRAVEAFDRAIALAPDPSVPARNKGVLIDLKLDRDARTGKFDEKLADATLAELRAIAQKFPNSAGVQSTLGRILKSQIEYQSRFGRWNEEAYAEARRRFERCLQVDPSDADYETDLALLEQKKLVHLTARGEFDEALFTSALAHGRRAIELSPNQPRLLVNVAAILYAKINHAKGRGKTESKLWDEAHQYLQEAIQHEPNDRAALISLGALCKIGLSPLYREKVFQEGEQAIRRALEIDPKDPPAWINLGVLYYMKQCAHSKEPDHPAGDEALKAIDRALEQFPNMPEGFANRGTILFTRFLNRLDGGTYREEELNEANSAFRRSTELNPTMFAPHWNRGHLNERAAIYLIQEGKPALSQINEALDGYSKAAGLSPSYPELNFRIARLWVRKVQVGSKDPQTVARAEQALDDILSKEPQKAAAFLERGRLRLAIGKYADAEKDLRLAAAMDSKVEAEAKPLIEECLRAMRGEH